ncbi:GatB/YqeY domain-containing protein [Roseovarius sp. D22-M7]|uniref:GatB/YqeY domain-containing protein n=1 Tax=Roseovarius sp. D22-M7 TaxID=3127116 RepID=UPI00300F96E6
MELRDRIAQALKTAMKTKDTSRLATLRLINAAIKDQEIAGRSADGETAVGDAEIMSILAKMIKQRNESVRAYEEAGRLDLAEQERAEIEVIEDFLPRQLSEAEIAEAIDTAIDEVGASSVRDMGKIMAKLKARYPGRMDFGTVGRKVKARLG